MECDVDIAAIGYPAVRRAFNDTLQLCVEKLTRAELTLAEDIIDADMLDGDEPGYDVMLADTALYSRKNSVGSAVDTRRAIDRIARKLPVKRDALRLAIAARLPNALFSIFAVDRANDDDSVMARDLLNGDRTVRIMDRSLAASTGLHGDVIIAGRFVDLGPWYIGFGVVVALRKSEAVAIRLALSDEHDGANERLHELIYPAHLHGADLVIAALEPMIALLALAIDTDRIDIDDLTSGFAALRPGKRGAKR